MLRLKPFSQSSAFCGPASLKLVLSYYGIRRSEKQIAKLCGYKDKETCIEEKKKQAEKERSLTLPKGRQKKLKLPEISLEEEEQILEHISDKGVTAGQILKAAKMLGLKGYVKDLATLDDIKKCIRKKIPVIVDWFSAYTLPGGGHYSVVVDIDKENIYLQDPEIGRMRAMRLSDFKSVWFDFDTDYPEKKEEFFTKRMIVIHK